MPNMEEKEKRVIAIDHGEDDGTSIGQYVGGRINRVIDDATVITSGDTEKVLEVFASKDDKEKIKLSRKQRRANKAVRGRFLRQTRKKIKRVKATRRAVQT